MPSIGRMELVIVLVVALLVFGPKRLPDAGRSLGRSMRELKDAISPARDRDEELPERGLKRAGGQAGAEDEPAPKHTNPTAVA